MPPYPDRYLGIGGDVLDRDDIRLAFDGDTEFLLHGCFSLKVGRKVRK
jgi:hypothetical protein